MKVPHLQTYNPTQTFLNPLPTLTPAMTELRPTTCIKTTIKSKPGTSYGAL